MKIDVDIATRIVDDHEEVFVLRPGEEFALYDDFVRRQHVFLDFPGIGLNLTEAFPKAADARAMVAKSFAIRDWHAAGRNGPRPEGDLRAYYQQAAGRRFGRYVGALERLFYKLPVGTLLIIPSPAYMSDVLVGEIVGDRTTIRIPTYEGEDLPARRVKWLGRKRKGSLSAELIERLKHRSPLTQLEYGLVPEVAKIGLDQFILDGVYNARFRTTKPEFSILDDYDIQSLLNYTAGVLAMIEDGVPRKEGTVSLAEAVRYLRKNRQSIPEFSSNINSPGFVRLFSEVPTPLVAAVILSMALSGASLASPGDIHVRNSKGPANDACPMVVEESVRSTIRMMRLDDLQAVCLQAQEVNKETGLSTSVKTKVAPAKRAAPKGPRKQ